jgi:hypothetical protein
MSMLRSGLRKCWLRRPVLKPEFAADTATTRGHMNSMHAWASVLFTYADTRNQLRYRPTAFDAAVPRRLNTRKWCPQRDVVLQRAKDDDVAIALPK